MKRRADTPEDEALSGEVWRQLSTTPSVRLGALARALNRNVSTVLRALHTLSLRKLARQGASGKWTAIQQLGIFDRSLVEDLSAGLHPRRRHDCEHLYDCEERWIMANGNTQARCPTHCSFFNRIDRTEPVSISAWGAKIE